MERAVLLTLHYSDIFDFPLKAWEIHKWLYKKQGTLLGVEKALLRLVKKGKIINKGEFYALADRKRIITQRQDQKDTVEYYLQQAELVAHILKVIPGILLIGISGGLAIGSAQVDDDIDLFVITDKNRLWFVRICALLILALLGLRRKPKMTRKQAAGRVCLNTILEIDHLKQERQDLYTAHEVLQMKVLWQRDNIYGQYLEENEWAFEYLPNWVSGERGKLKKSRKRIVHKSSFWGWCNQLSLRLQLKMMHRPFGGERVSQSAVYFHPQDYQPQILTKFSKRIKLARVN